MTSSTASTTPVNSVAATLKAQQQEANETLAVTRREAAMGDQAAIRKLARLNQGHQSSKPHQTSAIAQTKPTEAPAKEPGKGEKIDTKA
jgi:hypothetical protein